MNGITVVLKASNPEAISVWKAEVDLSFRRWQRQVEQLKKEFRIGDPIIRTDFNECWIVGYKSVGLAPVLGFRRDRKVDYLVPDTITPEGKNLAELLKNMRYKIGSVPGLPDVIRGRDSAGPFRVERLGTEWFATLQFSVWKKSLSGVDSKLWRMSDVEEYTRMLELEKRINSKEINSKELSNSSSA